MAITSMTTQELISLYEQTVKQRDAVTARHDIVCRRIEKLSKKLKHDGFETHANEVMDLLNG
jgi:hypothetical protein